MDTDQLDVNGAVAVAAVQRAVARGVSRRDVVRAAAACARAVLPLVPLEHEDVHLAVESVEAWLVEGEPWDTQALLCVQAYAVRVLRSGTVHSCPAEMHAALAAMMAAGSTMGEGLEGHPAVRSVRHAAMAAPHLCIDLGPIVTAALL